MTTGAHQASASDGGSSEPVGQDAGSDAMTSERTRRSVAASDESVEDDEDGNEKRRSRRRKNKGRKSKKQRRKNKKVLDRCSTTCLHDQQLKSLIAGCYNKKLHFYLNKV